MCPHVYIALSRRIKGNTALIKLTRKTKEHERTCQMVQLIFCYNTHSVHSYRKILIIFFLCSTTYTSLYVHCKHQVWRENHNLHLHKISIYTSKPTLSSSLMQHCFLIWVKHHPMFYTAK